VSRAAVAEPLGIMCLLTSEPGTGNCPAVADEYMPPDEFAKLPAAVHHAVWAARDVGWTAPSPGDPRRYNRAQVLEIAAGLGHPAVTVTEPASWARPTCSPRAGSATWPAR